MKTYKSTICSNKSLSPKRANALLREHNLSKNHFVPMFETNKYHDGKITSHKVTFYAKKGEQS